MGLIGAILSALVKDDVVLYQVGYANGLKDAKRAIEKLEKNGGGK